MIKYGLQFSLVIPHKIYYINYSYKKFLIKKYDINSNVYKYK